MTYYEKYYEEDDEFTIREGLFIIFVIMGIVIYNFY